MRGLHRLTHQEIKKTNKLKMLSDGGNLYLLVKSPTAKSWIYKWTRNKARRQFALGSYRDVPLAVAREMASKAREAIAQGKDPQKAIWPTPEKTFKEASMACVEARQLRWKEGGKTRNKWQRTISHYCGHLKSRPISSITREDILHLLKPVWLKTPETGRIVRGHLEIIFNYAKGRGWYQGENPAIWKGGLEAVLPTRNRHDIKHHAAMDYVDIPSFLEKLRNRDAMAARALEFCILTGTRTSETLLANFNEFDLDKGLWSLPPKRTKTGIKHVVPLSARAVEIVVQMQLHAQSEYVFPGRDANKPLSQMSMMMLLRRMKILDVTVHGFRSSFRDWAGDETEHPRDLVELCLGHTVGDKVERAYRRRTALERRARIMQDWADWCGGENGNNQVIKLFG